MTTVSQTEAAANHLRAIADGEMPEYVESWRHIQAELRAAASHLASEPVRIQEAVEKERAATERWLSEQASMYSARWCNDEREDGGDTRTAAFSDAFSIAAKHFRPTPASPTEGEKT